MHGEHQHERGQRAEPVATFGHDSVPGLAQDLGHRSLRLYLSVRGRSDQHRQHPGSVTENA
jgi:hypothetical protein